MISGGPGGWLWCGSDEIGTLKLVEIGILSFKVKEKGDL